MSAKLSRRQFLLRTAIGLGATVVACGGATTLATLTPSFDYAEQTLTDGENAVNQKILVAYATRCGSTMGVAEAIADELSKNGKNVDLLEVRRVGDLQGYSAVVLGSAIRMGNWVPEALKFVETNQAELGRMPLAIFSVHMQNTGDDEESQEARAGYHAAARKLVTPAAESWFSGAIDLKKMAFLDRMISKAMKAVDEDKRDWSAIRTWGQTLSTTI